MMDRILLLTMGDPAGIGPEVTVKALSHPEARRGCIPVVVGDEQPMRAALEFTKSRLGLNVIEQPEEAL